MIMMEKYPEAQEAMDNYLHEWNECYNTISENSKDEIEKCYALSNTGCMRCIEGYYLHDGLCQKTKIEAMAISKESILFFKSTSPLCKNSVLDNKTVIVMIPFFYIKWNSFYVFFDFF